jgi:hypothetical protein
MVLVQISRSQTDSSRNAIQFNFVNSASLSYRYLLSASSQLRASIDISGYLSDQKRSGVPVYYYSTDSLLYRYDVVNTSNDVNLRLSVDYLYTFYSHEHVSLYFSVGPFASTSHHEDHWKDNYQSRVSDNTYKYAAWSVGAILGFGLQCRVYEFVSVIGEYTATMGYGYESSPAGPPDERVISFKLEQIHIGICVQF